MSTNVFVRGLAPSFGEEYRREVGESLFCDRFDYRLDWRRGETCADVPAVELAIRNGDRKLVIYLCRLHATAVAHQILELVEMADRIDDPRRQA